MIGCSMLDVGCSLLGVGCSMLGSSSMVLISVHCWGSRPWPGVNFIFGLFIEFPLSLPEMGPDQARFLAMGSLSQMRPNAREAAPILVELLADRREKRPDFFAPLRLRCSSRPTELPVIPSCRSLAGGFVPNIRAEERRQSEDHGLRSDEPLGEGSAVPGNFLRSVRRTPE